MKLLKSISYLLLLLLIGSSIVYVLYITTINAITNFFIKIGVYNKGVFMELNTLALTIVVAFLLVELFNIFNFKKKLINKVLFISSSIFIILIILNFLIAFICLINNISKPDWLFWH